MPATGTFVATVRSIGSAAPLSRYAAHVRDLDALYMSGEFSTFLPVAKRG
jgi:hypothetical protein